MSPAPDRVSVVPTTAYVVAAMVTMFFCGIGAALVAADKIPPPMVLFIFLGAILMGGYTILIGYVYGDAKRRGMRYVMWTLLAALIPDCIGVILYFILREPMMVYCSHCGHRSKPGFAYCPTCGGAMAPTCPQCKKVVQTNWPHCAYCGTALGVHA